MSIRHPDDDDISSSSSSTTSTSFDEECTPFTGDNPEVNYKRRMTRKYRATATVLSLVFTFIGAFLTTYGGFYVIYPMLKKSFNSEKHGKIHAANNNANNVSNNENNNHSGIRNNNDNKTINHKNKKNNNNKNNINNINNINNENSPEDQELLKEKLGTKVDELEKYKKENNNDDDYDNEEYLSIVEKLKESNFDDDHDNKEYLSLMEKLVLNPPGTLPLVNASKPHQFLHLHHMKTAGTSMDSFFSCARRRYTTITGNKIPYTNIHECSGRMYNQCVEEATNASHGIENKNSRCYNRAFQSSMMSYCAPLKDLPLFGWTNHEDDHNYNSNNNHKQQQLQQPHQQQHNSNHDIQALTVLRHPVNRVWSMFRFQTKGCYKCRNLIDIYNDIDQMYGSKDHNLATMVETPALEGPNNNSVAKGQRLGPRSGPRSGPRLGPRSDPRSDPHTVSPICTTQILNHQVRNLLSHRVHTKFPDVTEEEILEDAISNMKSFFTVVGLTEEINTTVKIVSKVFPWMAPNISDIVDPATYTVFGVDYDVAMAMAATKGTHHSNPIRDAKDPLACQFPHANQSPRNNRCGVNNTHWDLPDHPDEETKKAIIEHNQLDIKLYEAAVQHFELQKRVLGID